MSSKHQIRGGEKDVGTRRSLEKINPEENIDLGKDEAGLQSTKDLPIKQIEREAYQRRKEKHGTHHLKEHNNECANETIGFDLVEQALHTKEEKDKDRGLTDFAAQAPSVLEDFHKGDILKVPDRDEELEKRVLRLSFDQNHQIDINAGEPIGHTENYPPKHDKARVEIADLPEFIQEQVYHLQSPKKEAEEKEEPKTEAKEEPVLEELEKPEIARESAQEEVQAKESP